MTKRKEEHDYKLWKWIWESVAKSHHTQINLKAATICNNATIGFKIWLWSFYFCQQRIYIVVSPFGCNSKDTVFLSSHVTLVCGWQLA